ncbi:protein kinase domain-containing protein [Wenjunlia vitaminophila]|uniref:protein kinase domain-containing protein n=1 Tax=Wenjunlia vitaminophila TaxID=76728 RepID=UPI0003A4C953|nr:protein kinase [Wenjunlia vitaminophila]
MRGELLDGRYRLREPLGSGGMSEVWRAEDERMCRPVAVKILSAARRGADAAVLAARFAREARTVGNLSHPHIVTLHDYGEDEIDGRRVLYLVMELLVGQDLGRVVADGLPSTHQVLDWAEQICDALQAAHRAGVVHRDVKPANVLLTAAGTIKVLDFGIVRFVEGAAARTTTLTETGAVLGTPAYMAPEQVEGRAVDARTDLYALGCVLYELVTGEPPFSGDSWSAVLVKHVTEPVVPPSSRVPGLPRELDQLILDLLAKEPEHRPGDTAEVTARLRAVRRLVGNGPGAAPAVPFGNDVRPGVPDGLGAPDVEGLDVEGPDAAGQDGDRVVAGWVGAGGLVTGTAVAVPLLALDGPAAWRVAAAGAAGAVVAAALFRLVIGVVRTMTARRPFLEVWALFLALGLGAVGASRDALPWWAELLVGAGVAACGYPAGVAAERTVLVVDRRPRAAADAAAYREPGRVVAVLAGPLAGAVGFCAASRDQADMPGWAAVLVGLGEWAVAGAVLAGCAWYAGWRHAATRGATA